MRVTTSGFARRLSVLLIAAFLLTITVPAYSSDQTANLSAVAISSITDKMGSININVGKGEGIKEGAKGVIIKDGKEVGKYIVQQVNWGFSRIVVSDLAEGVTLKPGDSAPLTAPAEQPQGKKKSSKNKTWLTILAVGAAILLLGGGGDDDDGGGSSGPSVSGINLTMQKSSTSTANGVTTCTVVLTARIYDSHGLLVADDTPVKFSTTAGTLNRTEAVVQNGVATANLTYNSQYDDDTATVTVECLGKQEVKTISFLASIDVTAEHDTIQALNTGGTSETTVTATCWDAEGALATSGTVKFTTNIGTFTTDTVNIGSNGTATTTFRSNTVGRADIKATWLNSSAPVTVTVTPGPPQLLTVTSDRASIVCDGSSSAAITATVKDTANHPVQDGTIVNFTVVPDGSGGGNGTILPAQVSTVNGVATAYLSSRDSGGDPSRPGTARIKVEVLRASQPASVLPPATDLVNQATTVKFSAASDSAGRPQTLTVTSDKATIGCDGSSFATITANVKDIDDRAVKDGTVVTFAVIPDGTGGGNGTIEPIQGATVNGVAIAHLFSRNSIGDPSLPGNSRIRVVVPASGQPSSVPAPAADLVNETAQVRFISAEVADIILTAQPLNIRGLDRSGNTSTITARVINTDGQNVPDGTVVYFEASNGNITSNAMTTGGIATATLTTVGAGGDPLVDVTATSGSVSRTGNDLVVFSGAPVQGNSTAVMTPSTTITRGGGATVTVTLHDANNNPVARGTSVTARVNNAYIGSPGTKVTTVTTEEGGVALITIGTSNDSLNPTPAGSDTVTVTSESVTFTINFTVNP